LVIKILDPDPHSLEMLDPESGFNESGFNESGSATLQANEHLFSVLDF
jgi:hypothetical protein